MLSQAASSGLLLLPVAVEGFIRRAIAPLSIPPLNVRMSGCQAVNVRVSGCQAVRL